MCTQMTIAASADMVRCDMAMLILNDVIEATWGTVMSANGYSRPSTVRGSRVGLVCMCALTLWLMYPHPVVGLWLAGWLCVTRLHVIVCRSSGKQPLPK